MATEIKQRPKVTPGELAALAGRLDYLKGMVEIERKVTGEASYGPISRTMEASIKECGNIADRLLYNGLEEEK